MDRTWLRAAQKLDFFNPAHILVKFRQLELEFAASDLPANVLHLRTNELKQMRERRQAALFCYGMSLRIGVPVLFSGEEAQDYDFVAMWIKEDRQHFAPVQLKEVVPQHRNPSATVEDVLQSLTKYPPSSRDLSVAIHLNQAARFEPDGLKLQKLNVGSVWFFAATTLDQTKFGLWGNFLEADPYGIEFAYPANA